MQSCKRTERIAFRSWVDLWIDRRRQRGTTRDLSSGGIGVELRSALPVVGTEVETEFSIPGITIPLALEGEIVWADRRTRWIGIRFRMLDPSIAEILGYVVDGRL